MERGTDLSIGLIAIIILCTLGVICSIAAADTQETHSVGYKLVRDQVETAEHDPNAVERTAAYVQEHYDAILYKPKREMLRTSEATRPAVHANYIQLIFTLNDADATATATVYAIRDPDGIIAPLEPVCSYNLVAGTQVADDDRYFADTATEVTDVWDVKAIDAGGDNGVAKIEFDSRGYYAFLVLFTTINTDDDVSCYAAYY